MYIFREVIVMQSQGNELDIIFREVIVMQSQCNELDIIISQAAVWIHAQSQLVCKWLRHGQIPFGGVYVSRQGGLRRLLAAPVLARNAGSPRCWSHARAHHESPCSGPPAETCAASLGWTCANCWDHLTLMLLAEPASKYHVS